MNELQEMLMVVQSGRTHSIFYPPSTLWITLGRVCPGKSVLSTSAKILHSLPGTVQLFDEWQLVTARVME